MESNWQLQKSSKSFAWIIAATIAILIVMTIIAGIPPANQITSFVIGIVVLLASLAGISGLAWYLFFSPLSEKSQKLSKPILTTQERHIAALLLTLGGLNIGMAGVWDEIWHAKYGIPFGQDFLWRPHMMMYFGFTVLIALAGWSWWTLMRRGSGTIQQRFRSTPILGVIFLTGLFTVYALGADPIWHQLYGQDLTPWSIPHLILLILVIVMALLAIAFHKSVMVERNWQSSISLSWRDVLISVVMAGVLLDYTLIMTVEWYAANTQNHLMQQVMARPDWVLPLFLAFIATLFGTTVLHATRRVGTATLVGVIAILARMVMDILLGSANNGLLPLWGMLPLLIGLDVWYWISIQRTQKPPAYWTIALFIAVVAGVTTLPLINALFPYPPITLAAAPAMIIASAVAAAVTAWIGQTLGDTGEFGSKAGIVDAAVDSAAGQKTSNRRIDVIVYTAFVAFLLFFILTATPPTLHPNNNTGQIDSKTATF